MADDILPGLLEQVKQSFIADYRASPIIAKALAQLEDGSATYIIANEYAIEVGELLAKALSQHVSSEVLPDGKMYYNIAKRLLNDAMGHNYVLISDYNAKVQGILNQKANIGLKVQEPKLNQDRIDGIVNRVSSEDDYNKVKWILDEPVVNFSQSIVDDSIRVNAEFQYKTGLVPKIIRNETGKCCDWCSRLVGKYEYPDVPKDVWRRHQRCQCTVDYYPGDGRKQNVWTKRKNHDARSLEQRAALNSQHILESKSTKLAYRLRAKAITIEPTITSDLKDIARHTNSELSGLAYRVKSVESLSRKIILDSENGLSLMDAAKNIKDVLRYTFVSNEEIFVDNYFQIIEELRKSGYNLFRVKNTFKEGSSYKGINTVIQKNSQFIEVQMHTPKSLYVKENILHKLYEEQRILNPLIDQIKYEKLQIQMIKESNKIPNPRNIERILEYE